MSLTRIKLCDGVCDEPPSCIDEYIPFCNKAAAAKKEMMTIPEVGTTPPGIAGAVIPIIKTGGEVDDSFEQYQYEYEMKQEEMSYLTVQPAVASGGGDHHFSLFGLSTVESWAVVGGGVILTLLIIVMMIALLAKRKMRCRLTRGKNTAEIDLNESGQPMMQQQQNTSAVSTV